MDKRARSTATPVVQEQDYCSSSMIVVEEGAHLYMFVTRVLLVRVAGFISLKFPVHSIRVMSSTRYSSTPYSVLNSHSYSYSYSYYKLLLYRVYAYTSTAVLCCTKYK